MVDSSDINREMPADQEEFQRPKGTLEVSAIRGLQGVTLDSVKSAASSELLGVSSTVRSNLFDRIDEWGQEKIVKPLQQIFRGLVPSGWESVAKAWSDGQLLLNYRLDLLSPLLDYGSAYMEAKGGFLSFGDNYGDMPIVRQVGPMRGCEIIDSGGIKLNAAGLWDIRMMMTFGKTTSSLSSGRIDMRVKVLAPDGQIFSQAWCFDDVNKAVTEVITTSVVVPEPGYQVKVEVAWVHGSRQIVGGPANNRLIVQRITNPTSTGDDGSENSDDVTNN